MTAREVVDLVKKNLGVQPPARSQRDTFKLGDPDTTVKGIATTMTATFDVLERANKAGLNMIIPHEGTFWNDPDNTEELLDEPMYRMKVDYVREHGMVIWRNHDHMHAMKPDFTVVGALESIGVKGGEDSSMQAPVLTIPETTFGEFASQVKQLTGSRAFRCVGDPNAKVRTVLLGPGYATPMITSEADVVIGGEQQEADGLVDGAEYAADAASLGIPKGLILLGHIVSEEPGMDEMAKWMRGFIRDIPIEYVPSGEPFWT